MTENESTPKSLVTDLYDRAAPTYDRIGPAVFSTSGRRLVELLELASGMRVLDLAVGRGAVLFAAAARVGPHGRAIGVDLSGRMTHATAADIERLARSSAEVCVMDAERLGFPDVAFDAVTCGFAIFYLRGDRVLPEAYRVLRPGGMIGVSLSAGTDARWKWYNQLLAEYDSRHHVFANLARGVQRDEVEARLVEARFTGVRVIQEAFEFMYRDEDEWWSALWTHGSRAPLERMSPSVLEAFKAEVYTLLHLQKEPDGLHQVRPVLFILASKPD